MENPVSESGIDSPPILLLTGVRFDTFLQEDPVELALGPGELAFIPGGTVAQVVLGLSRSISGQVRVHGDLWEDLSDRAAERYRRRAGSVIDPLSQTGAHWVSNLDVYENVMLGPSFEGSRNPARLRARAQELARSFGLEHGIPRSRPVTTSPMDLIRSQWVRALLPSRLDLLILENPLEFAPSESVAGFLEEVQRARSAGTAVLWVDRSFARFESLGLGVDLLCGGVGGGEPGS